MARMMTIKNWHHRMQSSAINSQITTAGNKSQRRGRLGTSKVAWRHAPELVIQLAFLDSFPS